MKNYSVVLLIAVLCFLTACEKKDEGLFGSSKVTDSGEETTLSFFFLAARGSHEDTELVLEKLEERARKTMNVRLDFEWINSREYENRVYEALSSDDPVDAFTCSEQVSYGFNFSAWGRRGLLTDIGGILADTAPYLYSLYNRKDLDAAKVDGKLYALPCLPKYFYQAKKLCANVPTEYLMGSGITDITRLEDLDAVFKLVKETDPDLVPCIIRTNELPEYAGSFGYVVLDPVQNLVYKWDDPDMEIIPFERTPEFQDIISVLEYWQEEGYIKKQIGSEYAVYLNLGFPLKIETMSVRSSGPDDRVEVQVMIFPLYPDTKIQRLNPIGNYFQNPGLAFNAKSKDTEAALKFVEWLHKDYDAYILLIRGIEGRHYELINGDVRLNQDNYFYNSGMNVFYDPEFELRMTTFENEEEEREMAESMKKYEDIYFRSEYPPHQGFYPDYSKIADAAAARAEALRENIYYPLSSGGFDSVLAEAELDNIKKDTEDIVTEVQRQLDEWRKQ